MLSYQPDYPGYLDSKGELYMLMGRKDEASGIYRKILELDPEFFAKTKSTFYEMYNKQ